MRLFGIIFVIVVLAIAIILFGKMIFGGTLEEME